MQIKMSIDECLEFADEWAKGCTFHEGSQGWRVACMPARRGNHGTGLAICVASLPVPRGVPNSNGHNVELTGGRSNG